MRSQSLAASLRQLGTSSHAAAGSMRARAGRRAAVAPAATASPPAAGDTKSADTTIKADAAVAADGAADEAAVAEELPIGAVADVEELRGVRVNVDENQLPLVEYLVHWKGGAPDTWEPSANIAENLLRDYEDRWWKACREGNEEAIKLMLGSGRRVLSQCVDKDRRSALHFAAATGNVRIARILCEAGSELDLMDKDGYTPLHMAAGYIHTPAVELLIKYGASPEIRDREGRSVLDLVERLKEQLPDDAQLAPRKFALSQCSDVLTSTLYDELEPMQLLDSRENEDGTVDYLVQWPDDTPDSWVNQADVAQDLRDDFKAGLEWAEASEIVRCVVRGDERWYLVRWSDGYPDSWQREERLSPTLIAAWEATQPADVYGKVMSKALAMSIFGGGRREADEQTQSSAIVEDDEGDTQDGDDVTSHSATAVSAAASDGSGASSNSLDGSGVSVSSNGASSVGSDGSGGGEDGAKREEELAAKSA
eukprot:CAMPEP_0206140168 /NCGR_PEP_ID=MMETSP1473-20131121/8670_1 /ASSEMBLY_ACC=CAM_ASM_001109 /TAXON_ID=1461547 /ORGANISM="Stichococcus sp, Strain RCC1054" /LENGTH=480 /DNA_ID=CAMNT_0053534233 /DNA_START=346 /DNA_END=1788 /DNA_ORIENTATION=-